MSLKALARADAAAQAAARRLSEATKAALPIGSVVTLRFYRSVIEAEVADHLYGDRVAVVNLATLKRRRISAAYKLRCGEMDLEQRGTGVSVYSIYAKAAEAKP